MKLKKLFLLLSVLILVYGCIQPGGAGASKSKKKEKISISPDIIIVKPENIGTMDEVLFDVSASITESDRAKYLYQWDFGDGSGMKHGSPYYYTEDDGVSCVHFYSKSGTYPVTLTVKNKDTGASAQVIKNITVTGNEWKKKFELLHANFNARISQYIYPKLLDSSIADAKLKIDLTSDSGTNITLYNGPLTFTGTDYDYKDKTQLKILLDNESLTAGNYKLTAKLYSGSDIADELTEKFTKSFSGRPVVGIDCNNNIFIGTQPVIPVTVWMLDKWLINTWSAYANGGYGEGYYDKHSTSTWTDYLNSLNAAGLKGIGPSSGYIPGFARRNTVLKTITDYVAASKDNTALLGWCWMDEPNMGGWGDKIPSQVMRAWYKETITNDQSHPVSVQLYGYDYLPYYGSSWADRYNYLYNSADFGGRKTMIFDITGFDIYPIDQMNHPSLGGGSEKNSLMQKYSTALDELITRNFNLTPAFSCVEVNEITTGDGSRTPTGDEIIMETWLNLVHGIKGIVWFQYFNLTNPQADDARALAMKKCMDTITKYTNALCGTDPDDITVTDSADSPNTNRADWMIKKDADGVYWLFAVRITEITETLPLDVTFTISGRTFTKASLPEESRSLTIAGGTFADTFNLNAVHIYKLE